MAIPSRADDAESVASVTRMVRASATPRTAAAQYDYFLRSVDVRRFLPLVQAATAVFHAVDSPLIPLAFGRYLVDHIPGATLVEMAGADLLSVAPDASADMMEFLTGDRPEVEVDRLLTTVVFTDIVGSTERAVALGDHTWRVLLDAHDRAVREQIRRFKGREIKTTGDGFLVSFDGPARAIRCAQAIGQTVGQLGIEVRTGLHTGECEVRGDDLGGLAVHVAARVAALAPPGAILVSGMVKDLVAGSGIEFEDRGERELKGVPGSWKLFAVQG
jgi:class 3 adenylate cyclase